MIRRLYVLLFVGCVTILGLTACGLRSGPVPRPTSTLVPVPVTVTPTLWPTPSVCTLDGKTVPCASIDRTFSARGASPTRPAGKWVTVEGQGIKVEPQGAQKVRLTITPNSPDMRATFDIATWDAVAVLFYWESLQTPTPVPPEIARDLVLQNAVGRRLTIGYYATEPPTVSLVSIHKQKGDSQK